MGDAVQSVCVLVYRKAQRLFDKPEMGGWFHRAATCACLTIRAKEGKKPAQTAKNARLGKKTAGVNQGGAAWEDARRLLDEAVVSLSVREREVLVLHYLEQRPLSAMAEEFACPVDALRGRLDKARERLRRKLRRRGADVLPNVLLGGLDGEAAMGVPAAIRKGCSYAKVHAESEVSGVSDIAVGAWRRMHRVLFIPFARST